MEKIAVRKNVLYGFALLYWPLALVVYFTERNNGMTVEEKRILSWSWMTAIGITVLSCIPFVGWAAETVLIVFAIIAIVQIFRGNLDYKMILISSIANGIIKE